MNKKMKLIFPAALAALIFGACSAVAAANPSSTNAAPAAADTNAAPATMASLFGDPVIAKGKGVEIKQSALDEVVLGIKSAAAARNQTIPPQQLMGIESQMLNRLIQIQLLLQKSTAADKAAGEAKAEPQLTNLLARAGSQAAFDRQLKAVGMTRGRAAHENHPGGDGHGDVDARTQRHRDGCRCDEFLHRTPDGF